LDFAIFIWILQFLFGFCNFYLDFAILIWIFAIFIWIFAIFIWILQFLFLFCNVYIFFKCSSVSLNDITRSKHVATLINANVQFCQRCYLFYFAQ